MPGEPPVIAFIGLLKGAVQLYVVPAGTTSPLIPLIGDILEKALSLHIVSLKLFICGSGLTVIITSLVSPSQSTVEGVT